MKNRLFRDNDNYTVAANDLDRETTALLKPLARRYLVDGYTSIDVEVIMSRAVQILMCELRMERSVKRGKPK